jgi:hypothetical protein
MSSPRRFLKKVINCGLSLFPLSLEEERYSIRLEELSGSEKSRPPRDETEIFTG